MIDYDPRLVDLYDVDNPDGPDHDFYRALADEVRATSIVDLGCGTGLLTVTLAGPGRSVLGIDPSSAMLRLARSRPGAGRVRWVHGDSRSIPTATRTKPADYVVLTGNVAQHLIGMDWTRALSDLHRGLRPGGVLAFESRNPAVRAWRDWAAEPPASRMTAHGPLTEWSEIEGPDDDGVVELISHNRFEQVGETVVQRQRLAFRDRARLRADLVGAGFEVEAISGDWDGRPFAVDDRLLIVRARRGLGGRE